MSRWILGICILIILDWVTGIAHAIRTKTVQSSKMRSGLTNKGKELFAISVGVILDRMQSEGYIYLPFEFLPIISAYLALMEIFSIFENVGFVLPPQITKYFKEYDIIEGGDISEKGGKKDDLRN